MDPFLDAPEPASDLASSPPYSAPSSSALISREPVPDQPTPAFNFLSPAPQSSVDSPAFFPPTKTPSTTMDAGSQSKAVKNALNELDRPERVKYLSVIDKIRETGVTKDISLPQVFPFQIWAEKGPLR